MGGCVHSHGGVWENMYIAMVVLWVYVRGCVHSHGSVLYVFGVTTATVCAYCMVTMALLCSLEMICLYLLCKYGNLYPSIAGNRAFVYVESVEVDVYIAMGVR